MMTEESVQSQELSRRGFLNFFGKQTVAAAFVFGLHLPRGFKLPEVDEGWSDEELARMADNIVVSGQLNVESQGENYQVKLDKESVVKLVLWLAETFVDKQGQEQVAGWLKDNQLRINFGRTPQPSVREDMNNLGYFNWGGEDENLGVEVPFIHFGSAAIRVWYEQIKEGSNWVEGFWASAIVPHELLHFVLYALDPEEYVANARKTYDWIKRTRYLSEQGKKEAAALGFAAAAATTTLIHRRIVKAGVENSGPSWVWALAFGIAGLLGGEFGLGILKQSAIERYSRINHTGQFDALDQMFSNNEAGIRKLSAAAVTVKKL